MEKLDETTTNSGNTEDDSDNLNPWPQSETIVQSEHQFEDKFCAKKNDELNQNGLVLPDSQQYLDVLEKRLKKIQTENRGRETQAKKMLKALATKRDELFLFENRQNISNDPNSTLKENVGHFDDEIMGDNINESNKITSAITGSALYETVERKMFPHLHSTDPEEFKRLLNHDVLDNQFKNDSTTLTNDGDNHDFTEATTESKES